MANKPDVLIPLQVKPQTALRAKLVKIAADSGLSLNDVANLALAAGAPVVAKKLAELRRK